MVSWMLKTQRNIIYPETEELLVSSAKQVSENQSFYDAPFDIYGDFKDVFNEALRYLEK